ncbi:MAG: polyphosphate kinase 1 [Leptospiraceae bacterium]|nr:polyphosphate kinase 1 [Leptospiraceae bacterium]MCK6381972.1 polyphosphate kinase 1 [Leptospiraceae bacterium]
MDETKIDKDNSELFFDRELSWLDFNCRVLEEAKNPENPILERLKFLCITETNLDEFFMIRVAGLRFHKKAGNDEKSLNGMRISEILLSISKKVSEFVESQYRILTETIMPELKQNGINIIVNPSELNQDEIKFIKKYYKEEVSSILTPLSIDPSHPFPHVLNRTLNLAIVLSSDEDKVTRRDLFAVVQVPSVLPRFLKLPNSESEERFFPLEEIIKLHLSDIFFGMTIKEIHAFRILRDADISFNEETANDLLLSVKNELKNRIWGDAVRLDVHQGAAGLVKSTLEELNFLNETEIHEIPSILNLNDLMYFYGLEKTAHLKFPFFISKNALQLENPEKIFSAIRKSDKLLHHPFDSFQTIEELLKIASEDPKVLAIKMTLYRTSGDSPIIQYLGQAAENGKQVTVLVELKARFDEERNIKWAQKLEDSGVHVVYGVVGLKIHCKMMLIVRRENDKLRRYVHLGTGNYNSTTAKYYTDISLLTMNEEITEDVGLLFNALTSFARMPKLKKLSAAPHNLKKDILDLISEETTNAEKGIESKIFLKMNSLVDPDVMVALYKASIAGVKIDLVIRGVCCIRPGIPGVSENIQVRSIVGRFLEHSRIYIFHNNGKPKIFLASADCMPRNFEKRIEVMFPILDEKMKSKILEIKDYILRDNTKARILLSNGIYKILTPGTEQPFNSQMELTQIA